MDDALVDFPEPSRLRVLLDRLSEIADDRETHRVAYPLAEILLLAVCGTIADCDDYDAISEWGEAHLAFLRRFLAYHHGVPSGRWLTIMMNRIDPALFSACFCDWVRACWPDRPDLVAIDGKTLRRSHDRSAGRPALHLVSAFASNSRLVLGQEAVSDKAGELSAIPILLERLAQDSGLEGAVVSIDAIACNGGIAKVVRDAGADYLLAVKANQPSLRADVEAAFTQHPIRSQDRHVDVDKGHGRIEQRDVAVVREVDWLGGDRRFPGELRLPGAAALVRVHSRVQLKDRCRSDVRYFITSADRSAEALADMVRKHWAIENQLHWTLDVVFDEDRSRLRKGHGARNMAVVRHFALNLVRNADEGLRPPRSGLRRKTAKPPAPRHTPIKRRRKIASWNPDYLAAILTAPAVNPDS